MAGFRIKRLKSGNPLWYLVLDGDREVGMLEKYRNTKIETHPWKAFLGIGAGQRLLNCFYGPNGKQDAVQAILDEAGL